MTLAAAKKERKVPECRPESQEHMDAQALVHFLMDENGSSPLPNGEIALKLGFVTRKGKNIEVDENRYYRARNHLMERVDADGKPCCHYRVHYRSIDKRNHLALIDPTGDLGEHAVAVLGTVRGFMRTETQRHTENTRMVESFDKLGEHALARHDKDGYRLCQRAIIDISDLGTVKPTTLAELNFWVDTLAVA